MEIPIGRANYPDDCTTIVRGPRGVEADEQGGLMFEISAMRSRYTPLPSNPTTRRGRFEDTRSMTLTSLPQACAKQNFFVSKVVSPSQRYAHRDPL